MNSYDFKKYFFLYFLYFFLTKILFKILTVFEKVQLFWEKIKIIKKYLNSQSGCYSIEFLNIVFFILFLLQFNKQKIHL